MPETYRRAPLGARMVGLRRSAGPVEGRHRPAAVSTRALPRSMGAMSSQPPSPRPGRDRPPRRPPGLPGMPGSGQNWSRPIVWALIGMVVIAFLLSSMLGGKQSTSIRYIPTFLEKVRAGEAKQIDVTEDHATHITGKTTDGTSFTTTAPATLPDGDLDLFSQKNG